MFSGCTCRPPNLIFKVLIIMKTARFALIFVFFAALITLSGCVNSCVNKDEFLIKQLAIDVVNAQTSLTLNERARAAENIELLSRYVKTRGMAEYVVKKIIPLLESGDDSVRYWTASALVNLGPASRIAVPALLKAFPKGYCLRGPVTSTGEIRLALYKLGVKFSEPQVKCGQWRYVQ